MGKFNKKVDNKVHNLAGGQAYKQSTKLELVSILLTSFVSSQFYRSENDTVKRLLELAEKEKDKKFIAKASLYARLQYGMRSISHIIAATIANKVKGENWTKNYFNSVVHRVDDITEILSYYINTYGKRPLPNALKKGLKVAFNKFDEYQLAKYKAAKKELSLVDAVNILHPIPNEKNKEALKKLVDGKLVSKGTWESELTQAGQKSKDENEKQENKKQVWINLIREKKIGYFALLKNLRNILEQAPEIVNEACELLVNEKMIRKSLVLPFRYLTAIKEIVCVQGSQKVLMALNKAVDISLKNVPKFDGDTLVVLDTSGSMQGRPAQIGSLFSSILVKTNICDFMVFSDNACYQTLNPMDSTLTVAKSIQFAMGGTNFHSVFQKANKAYDRIIILSDMQGWVGYYSPAGVFNEYKKRYNCSPYIYSIDLQGYGSLQFPENNVFCMAGFSEKIFDIMKLLEKDRNALIKEIEKIEL
jgi:hypothetical protein